jgi:hypothetical protein
MAIKIEANELGGETAILRLGDELTGLPKRFRDLIHPEELQCIKNPSQYFSSKGQRIRFEPMAAWLKNLVDNNNWEFEINFGGKDCADYNDVFVRYEIAGAYWSGVKLRREKAKSTYPYPLDELYSILDGMNHCGFGVGGGIFRSNSIQLAANDGPWLNEKSLEIGQRAFSFYSTPSGEGASYTANGDVYWYEHGSGSLVPYGTLTNFFDRYFSNLLHGKLLGE